LFLPFWFNGAAVCCLSSVAAAFAGGQGEGWRGLESRRRGWGHHVVLQGPWRWGHSDMLRRPAEQAGVGWLVLLRFPRFVGVRNSQRAQQLMLVAGLANAPPRAYSVPAFILKT